MAHDFENIDDLDDLSDSELRRLVRDRLREHRGLDPADITVDVHDRVVELSGRVGTEGERRVAERVVTDLIGLPLVRNDLVVDSLRRAESPEAADESSIAAACCPQTRSTAADTRSSIPRRPGETGNLHELPRVRPEDPGGCAGDAGLALYTELNGRRPNQGDTCRTWSTRTYYRCPATYTGRECLDWSRQRPQTRRRRKA